MVEGDWRKTKPSVGEAMSHILQTGLYTDMTFRVGPTKEEVNVHKVILMARSEPLAAMLQDRWDRRTETSDRSVIDILGASPNSFNHFIKYLYTDEFEGGVSIEDGLEVLRLAHMYQVHGLISKSLTFLKLKLSVANCVQIYQGTRLYSGGQGGLSQTAFEFMEKNIKAVVTGNEFLELDEEGLTQLLQSNNFAVQETELFKGLMRWSQEEVQESTTSKGRKEIFKDLIPYIRFPLMGAEGFGREVVPTNVLSNEEVIALFLYFSGGSPDGLRFSAQPRTSISLKFLKVYKNYDTHTLQQLQTVLPRIETLQFRLKCTKGITFHGLSFYGLAETSQPVDIISEYDISYRIYALAELLGEKASKIHVSIPGNLNLLLDKPVQVQANKLYWVGLSLNVKNVNSRDGCSGANFHIGIGETKDNRTERKGNLIDSALTIEFFGSHKGMIESIIYSL